MLVKQVMNKKPICLRPEDYIIDVIKIFKKHKVHGAPVLRGKRVVGILTERDILDFMEIHDFSSKLLLPAPFDFIEAVIDARAELFEVEHEFNKLKQSRVATIMRKKFTTISSNVHVSEAADIMTEEGVTHLPVVEKGILVGLLTRSDLIKSLL